MQTKLNLRVPTADGVEMATDVFRPNGPGPVPAILIRTPYHRSTGDGFSTAHLFRFLDAGYAVVVQDVRGKYDSDGSINPVFQETADGHAALDWIANQHWSNGRIGLWGPSYLAMTQLPAAAGTHPALKAICPAVGPAHYFRDWVRYDGCFALYNQVRWGISHGTVRCKPNFMHFDWLQLCRLRTHDAIAARVGIDAPWLRDWTRHDTDNAFWAPAHHDRMYPTVAAAGHHSGGWFDHISRGQIDDFRNLRTAGATPATRRHQFLVMGPWGHINALEGGDTQRRYGDWDFGPDACAPLIKRELRFLDHFVAGKDNGFDREAPVRIFLVGANRWLDLPDWPPPATTRTLHLDTKALLDTAPATHSESTVRHDPLAPVPTRGGPIYWGMWDLKDGACGPVDQRPLLSRADVRYYRGEPLAAPLTVIGEPTLDITLSSSVEDADLMAKLCVEQPDGAVVCLTVGQIRCRYRDGFTQSRPLPRGEPVRLSLRCYPLAYQFPAGARIGLILAHSDFPRIEPHPGTLEPPMSAAIPQPAALTIHHGPASSTLHLPVVDVAD